MWEEHKKVEREVTARIQTHALNLCNKLSSEGVPITMRVIEPDWHSLRGREHDVRLEFSLARRSYSISISQHHMRTFPDNLNWLTSEIFSVITHLLRDICSS